MMEVQISDWMLLQLTVEDVGPFRNGPQTFSFVGEPTDGDPNPGPSNLYMLLAKNAHGKTTLLECIYGIFGLLALPAVGRFADPRASGRAQVDIRTTLTIQGKVQTVVLSIWTGANAPLVTWTGGDLDRAQASEHWARLNLGRGFGEASPIDGSEDIGLAVWRSVLEARGRAPEALFGVDQDMPTVLFFPADRRMVRPDDTRRVERPDGFAYQPAQCFASDGPEWGTTIDNLLVWLEWLDDGRLEQLLEFVNTSVFDQEAKAIRPPRRQELLTYVSTAKGDHPLIGLSHGERALLQFYVRLACQMTSSTIVLVDEIETHLHGKWMFQLFQGLKRLLNGSSAMSVVFTTHNRELIRVFDHQQKEEGLVKGGYLLEDDMA